ncbi:SIS domain-containing protein [Fusobacterium perfoetens]|jgi:glucoselysine-6-phosphate deglycase|uniref:SIS domain-containing protein n=1 Tax=Fusobacterium perfoetens TaxID=852 RepID=UPI0026ED0EE1|nr:SIS domain-containing protein [Fusobacterium perfoetens]
MKNITSNMYNYICETPIVLKKMIENRKEITKEFVEFYKEKNIEQIYIIGSGTSYHAGLSAKVFLEEILGKKVFCMYPTQFARAEKVFNKNTLVIGVSQGGQSLSTVEGLDSAIKNDLFTAAVSENPTALIFEHSKTKTLIEVGNEKCGAKTKGFAGTTLTLMLMIIELLSAKKELDNSKIDEYFSRMEKVIENMKNVIETSTKWFEKIGKELIAAKRIIVVGYENNYADVLEGALKILETVRQGVTGYDIEEFFHGIYNSINDDTYIFYLASEGDYKERTQKLLQILSEWTPYNYMITSPQNVEKYTERDLICQFTEDKLFGQWEYIIPLQIVSCLGAKQLGINPDIPKDPNFHRRVGSKKLDGIRDQYTLEK